MVKRARSAVRSVDTAAEQLLPHRSLSALQGVGVTLLIIACLLNIAAVYVLVQRDAAAALVLAVGIFGMGEAWGGAFFLERKRLVLARALAAAGVAEIGLIALPVVRDSAAGQFIVASAFLSAVGLALAWSRR